MIQKRIFLYLICTIICNLQASHNIDCALQAKNLLKVFPLFEGNALLKNHVNPDDISECIKNRQPLYMKSPRQHPWVEAVLKDRDSALQAKAKIGRDNNLLKAFPVFEGNALLENHVNLDDTSECIKNRQSLYMASPRQHPWVKAVLKDRQMQNTKKKLMDKLHTQDDEAFNIASNNHVNHISTLLDKTIKKYYPAFKYNWYVDTRGQSWGVDPKTKSIRISMPAFLATGKNLKEVGSLFHEISHCLQYRIKANRLKMATLVGEKYFAFSRKYEREADDMIPNNLDILHDHYLFFEFLERLEEGLLKLGVTNDKKISSLQKTHPSHKARMNRLQRRIDRLIASAKTYDNPELREKLGLPPSIYGTSPRKIAKVLGLNEDYYFNLLSDMPKAPTPQQKELGGIILLPEDTSFKKNRLLGQYYLKQRDCALQAKAKNTPR